MWKNRFAVAQVIGLTSFGLWVLSMVDAGLTGFADPARQSNESVWEVYNASGDMQVLVRLPF